MNKLVTLLLMFCIVSFATAGEWKIDKSHTSVKFTIAHMVVTDVVGTFNDFNGTIVSPGETFDGTSVNVEIDINSINTNNQKRDDHLRSADFFDAEKFPKMTFKSKEFKKVSDNKYKIVGDLMMRGKTKEVELDANYRGEIKDPWGNTRAGFKAKTTIDRYDWDLKYNSTLEAGGLLIGRELDIEINIELIKQ